MVDRISELPDDVLQQILQLLPLKEAVRTSILSKRWTRIDVCSTFLGLNFILDDPWTYTKNVRKKFKRSLYILDKLVRQRRRSDLSVQKFEVMISINNLKRHPDDRYCPPTSRDELIDVPLGKNLDRWMLMVANPGLTVLDLKILLCEGGYYNMPLSTLAAAKSLKTLSLGGFQVFYWRWDTVAVSFPCLEQLSLERVMLDDFVMEDLLKGSPLLENLQLVDCWGVRILKVEGLSRLKTFRVIGVGDWFFDKIVIDAPCLRVLKIHANPVGVITLATCPKYLHQLECRFRQKSLITSSFHLEGAQLPIKEELFCRFVDKCCFLRHLTISNISNVEKIHIPSTLHALKTLHLYCHKDLTSFEMVAPNLDKFYMVPETNLPFVCLNSSKELEVELCLSRFWPDGGLNNQWYTRWTEFLSYFKHSRALIIEAKKEEKIFVPKEIRKDLSPSLFGVKSLELRMLHHCPSRLSDYIDYMLWLSPQATKLTLCEYMWSIMKRREVIIKCLYNENKTDDHHEGSCCVDCNLVEVRCWRHSLKQVRIEEFLGGEMEELNIKSFFREQVQSLDFMEPISGPDCLEDGLYYDYDSLFANSIR